MGDDRPAVYEDDGKVVYRASSFGGCPIALAAARQNYDPRPYPKQALEVFAAGQEAEDWFFGEYRHKGLQQVLELAVTGKIAIRAHADAWHPGDEYGYEIKSQSGELFDKWTPGLFASDPLWIKYGWQISTMMHASGAMWQLVRVNRDDLSSTGIARHNIEQPFYSLDEIRSRVFEVEGLAREAELRCDRGEFFCPYPYLHTEEEIELVDDRELDNLTAGYLTTRKVADEINKAVAGYREKILGRLNGRRKVRLGSGVKVTVSEVEVKEHLVKASTQTRLTVKEPKNE